MHRSHEDHLRERQTRARLWLSQGGESEIVGRVCDQWIRDLVQSGSQPLTGPEVPGLPPELNLVTRLSNAGLTRFSDAFVWAVHVKVGIEPLEAPLIGQALAKAAGRAYSTYGPDQLDWIGHMVSTVDYQAWETFADNVAIVLREDDYERNNFVNFLVEVIQITIEKPDTATLFPPPRTSMAQLIEQYVQTGSFQEVWRGYSQPIPFRWNGMFEILRRTDPARFVAMIDDLPHPLLVTACLSMPRLIEDAEATLQLLRVARASFDAEGRWQQHGVAAVLLLHLASNQLLSVEGNAENNTPTVEPHDRTRAPQNTEGSATLTKQVAGFKKSVDNLLDHLLSRSDGEELGWHWLENLVRRSPSQRPPLGDQSVPKCRTNFLNILIHSLSSRLAPRLAQSSWISEVEPLGRHYRAIAVLSVVGFSDAARNPDVGAIALELLKRNDIRLLSAKEQIELPGAPLRTIPGSVLSQMPDVALWFTKAWAAIRLVREQAWHAVRAGDPIANPAEIIALWGLGVVEALATTKMRPSDPQAMWLALEVTFREAQLVEPRWGRDFWTQGMASLFAWWFSLFTPQPADNSDETASDISNALGVALQPYVGISADFMAIIVRLYEKGVPVSVLDRAVRIAREDLFRVVRRFLDTAPGLNDAQLWNQKWVALVRRVEEAIALERLGNNLVSTQALTGSVSV